MDCGEFRCTGKEYAEIIMKFDVASFDVHDYETIFCSENLVQNHYIVETKVKEERNKDLEGIFHVASTWTKQNQDWKLIYNMDSRIMEEPLPEQQYIIRQEEEKDYYAVEALTK